MLLSQFKLGHLVLVYSFGAAIQTLGSGDDQLAEPIFRGLQLECLDTSSIGYTGRGACVKRNRLIFRLKTSRVEIGALSRPLEKN